MKLESPEAEHYPFVYEPRLKHDLAPYLKADPVGPLLEKVQEMIPSYPGQPPIIHGVWKTHEESLADNAGVHGNMVMHFSMPDHGGTHPPRPDDGDPHVSSQPPST